MTGILLRFQPTGSIVSHVTGSDQSAMSQSDKHAARDWKPEARRDSAVETGDDAIARKLTRHSIVRVHGLWQ